MASILGTQSGIYQPPRQRVLDANAQQADASGAGQAAPAAGGGDGRATEAVAQATTQPVLDPSQVRSRIDGLIDGHVASGSLTGDQARVLKQVLGSGPADTTAEPADGSRAAGAPGSPTPDAASRPGQAGARLNPSEVLASFIRQLQTPQGRISGYASDGSSDGARLTSSRLLDFNT